MNFRNASLVCLLVVGLTLLLGAATNKTNGGKMDFYALKATSISGEEIDFAQFKGKKVLLVNTASACGFTPQLEALEALHRKYGDQLQLIGIPTDDFGGQEPLEGKEIQTFCQKNYGVSFLMLDKTTTKGSKKHPVFRWLTEKDLNGRKSSRIWWNFQKYLVDEEGELVDYFLSTTKPDSPKIVKKIED